MKKPLPLIVLISCLITSGGIAQSATRIADTKATYPLLEKMHQSILNKEYPNVHSVLVMHKGKLIYEKYYTAKDEALGEDLGIVKHSKETLHDLRSVTKSIVSICIGLAISQGRIKDENQPVMKFFPSYKDLDTGWRSQIKIKDLLTMSSGMEWNENLPYTDTLNSELAMAASADPIRFILSRRIIEEPGKTFNYNGGNTQLLAAIIESVCGITLDKFVQKHLFHPLGITNFYWYPLSDKPLEKNNMVAAASGLRLRSPDMLKIGTLLLNNGSYSGKQLVPKDWIQKSLSNHISRDDQGGGYGYQFWVFKTPGNTVSHPLPAAVGNGDQRIFIDHHAKLVVVITSGNYNKWDLKKASYELLADFIYPAIGTKVGI